MKKATKKTLHFLQYFILCLALAAVISLLFYAFLIDRIFPGVSVGGEGLSFLTQEEAQGRLDFFARQRINQTLFLTYQGITYPLDLSSLAQDYSSQNIVSSAFEFGHTKTYLTQIDIPLFTKLNPAIDSQIVEIARRIDQPAQDAQISFVSGNISVTQSSDGWGVDQEALKSAILSYLNSGQNPPQNLPIKRLIPHLSYNNALELKKKLEVFKANPLTLTFLNQSFSIDLPTIISLLGTSDQSTAVSGTILGYSFNVRDIYWQNTGLSDIKFYLDPIRLDSYLRQNIAPAINRDVREPIFDYDGKKVINFQPPQEGYNLNLENSTQTINQHLASSDTSSIALSVDITPPKNQLVNQLGIKELIGRGISHFAHSIPNRIYNVELAASRINGTIIPPGGIFSFNQAVGDISGATGYKSGYIIKAGRTVLDDGGGVCQDSTTLFRAALNAGLPITSRTAHAYRVGYYEQDSPPGLDATVFAPSVDFRFKNDTPASILIQAYTVDDYILYMDLYGTSDGRVSQVSTPVIVSQTPPPPDVHQDDSTLPKGQIKQVDFSAWGASVVFNRTVSRGGKTLISETYRSNYQPWAAVYLVGTGG